MKQNHSTNHLYTMKKSSHHLSTHWLILTYHNVHSTVAPKDEITQPCNPSPCGSNAVCTERNGAGACSCLPDYFGDPYSGCRPECVTNNDCPRVKACLNNKCYDPCPGVCGSNAECRVVNHAPQCTCIVGYTGNPLSGCHEPPQMPSKMPSILHATFIEL